MVRVVIDDQLESCLVWQYLKEVASDSPKAIGKNSGCDSNSLYSPVEQLLT